MSIENKGQIINQINKNMLQYLKSRAVWTVIILFIINGVTGVKEFIPVNLLPIIDAILGLMIVYFRVRPKQNFQL